MSFFKMSMKYITKNYFRLILFVLIPAILFGITFNMADITIYIKSMSSSSTISFARLYGSISLVVKSKWYISIPAVITTIYAISCLSCMIDRHMRIGKFSYKFYKYTDETLRTGAPIVSICILLYEAFSFVFCGLIVLLGQFIPMIAMPYIIVIVFAMQITVILIGVVNIALWYPICHVKGYKMGESITSSARIGTKQFGAFFVAFLMPMLIYIVLGILVALFLSGIASAIVSAILNTFILMIFATTPMVIFSKVYEYDRRDIKPRLFRKGGK